MVSSTAFVLGLLNLITVSALTLNGPWDSVNASSNYICRCSDRRHGRNLDSASCVEALRQIDASSTVEQTYGERYTGPYDVKLPKRYTSSNGLCAIEPRLGIRRSSARASLQEVASAARYGINRCVNTLPSRGGTVGDIGGDNGLVIIIMKLSLHTQCSGTVAPSLLSSCQNLLDVMPASLDYETWGPPDDPLAGVKLPLSYYSQDRHCKLTINSDGHTDTACRYQFWSWATIVTNSCVRHGQMGLLENIGMRNHLSVEIGPA